MHNWLNITTDPQILEIIEGYKLKFTQTSVQLVEPTNPPCSNAEMNNSIEKLLELGSIVPCEECDGQFISIPCFLFSDSEK